MTNIDNAAQIDKEKAEALVADVPLPPEIESVTIEVGEDSSGEPALFLNIHVNPQLSVGKSELAGLTSFSNQLQSRLLDGGIELFPYIKLEQAA